MQNVTHEMELPKEAYELGMVVRQILMEYKKAKADGWSPGTDIPQVIIGSMHHMMSALEGLSEIDDEFKANPMTASLAITVPILDGVGELLKK